MRIIYDWLERIFDTVVIIVAGMILWTMIVSLAKAEAMGDAGRREGPGTSEGVAVATPDGHATSPALPDTRLLMSRVERILLDAGYKAKGYGDLPKPNVFLTADPLPRGDWGWYVPGTVLLSSAQPAGCIRITLAHELAHDATARMGLMAAQPARTPAWALRAEMERIASVVEAAVADDAGWAPNCLLRRGVS